MKKWDNLIALMIGAFVVFNPLSCSACTDFLIKSQDNAYLVGRSLEFGQVLPTKVKICPSGETVQSLAPNNQNGMKWTSKYTYAAMAIFDADIILDGFNERGLSVGALWFPDGKYPDVTSAPANTVMGYTDLMRWILGNFAYVQELKAALPKVNIYAFPLPELGNQIAPIHLSIHDTHGESLVLEFIDGKMRLFDNEIGVLTNSPEFPWHETNLRNYINLNSLNAGKVSFDGSVLTPIGQGSGLLGIPGDWTPPSRFIRAAAFKQFAKKPENAGEAANTAIHILNTVDIPYGVIRGSEASDFDYTQWIVVKDLTNKKLYVRTYGNQNVQVIDLINEKLVPGGEPKKIAIGQITPR